jgi:hypothetical protein
MKQWFWIVVVLFFVWFCWLAVEAEQAWLELA